MNNLNTIISERLKIDTKQVLNTVNLLKNGATIPFISRYRKEVTGGLDEVEVEKISIELKRLEAIEERKDTIVSAIEEQGKLSDELKKRIENCYESAELEDLYLPFKKKRKTKATEAKEAGLEPLAGTIMKQQTPISNIIGRFLNDKVENEDDAIEGAKYIIAEWINENAYLRSGLRRIFERNASVSAKFVKSKEEEEGASKYKDYNDFSENIKRCASHRFMAINRGANEGFLRLKAQPEKEKALQNIEKVIIKNPDYEDAGIINEAIKDSYQRLLMPSLETEVLNNKKEQADKEAIKVFAENLRQLLLSPPLGKKRVLAVDPGYRTGCKVVCLDETGKLLHNENIYPHAPKNEKKQAAKKLTSLVSSYAIDAIAIGNGTASRETEHFVTNLKYDRKVQVFVVSEAGASVYSASKIAREEFPQYDVTVRGAVSIGRRLIDPLSELVKIEPKSIGVGQYQHDVNQAMLQESLKSVVESCVNLVGVNVNTAGEHLLAYVSGIGPVLAKNIVSYRDENGIFTSRKSLKKVPRLGSKAFEQCAGFIRVPESENLLDNTSVHPESYGIVEKMAKDLNVSLQELIEKKELQKEIKPENYINNEIGLPTINLILKELQKPGRDPREIIKVFEFSNEVYKPEDLKPGMILPGIVTNITNFGVFVDVGVKQDGLVHISNLKNEFVSNPADVVRIHQHVTIKVLDVDLQRKRLQFSMKDVEQE